MSKKKNIFNIFKKKRKKSSSQKNNIKTMMLDYVNNVKKICCGSAKNIFDRTIRLKNYIRRMPFIYKIILSPFYLFSFIFRPKVQQPILVSQKEIVPYLAKVKSENIKYKSGIITLAIILLSIISFKSYPSMKNIIGYSYIAKISISGEIGEQLVNEDFVKKVLEKVEKDKNAIAVIAEIDSPGGSVYHSQKLYRGLRRISAQKPLIAVVNSMAASGGYMAAVACDKIFALESSLVGSIGVISALPNYKQLLDKIGIKYIVYKSSTLKAAPNSFEDVTPEVSKKTMQSILSIMNLFTSIVKERRELSNKQMSLVSDASTYYGLAAIEKKLIDGIADERQVVEMLVENKIVGKNTKVVNVKPKLKRNGKGINGSINIINKILHRIASNIGIDIAEKESEVERQGLLLKYHPEAI